MVGILKIIKINTVIQDDVILQKKKDREYIPVNLMNLISFNAKTSLSDSPVYSAIFSQDNSPSLSILFTVSILVSIRSSFHISSIALHIVAFPFRSRIHD